MMAMTGSPDMAAFGKRHSCDGGCHGGCTGYVAACYGGYGGCSGGGGCHGCHGGRTGLFHKGSKGCHGCTGGSCHGCYGGGCTGYTAACGCCGGYAGGGYAGGCYGGYGGYAAPMGAPMGGTAPQAMPKPSTTTPGGTAPTKPPEVRANVPATIVVSLPEGAKLSVDGVATKSTTAVRTFATPALPAGQSYYYTLTAEVVREGQTLTATEQVTVRAGETSTVTLPADRFTTTVSLK